MELPINKIKQRYERLRSDLFGADQRSLGPLERKGLVAARVAYLAVREFRTNFCLERAAALTFASIISLIPLAVLFFSFAGLLGGGKEIIDFVQHKVFDLVAPEFQEQLNLWLERYISPTAFRGAKTELVNLAAIFGLIGTSMGVFIMAERVFNHIWKVRGARSYLQKLMVFWVLLTTSPFLVLASMWMGDYLTPAGGLIQTWTHRFWFFGAIYSFLVPVMIGFLGFTMVNQFLPTARVNPVAAALGGATTALIWELLKRVFYFYMARTVTYTSFYQNLATVPLFLIWIYLNWAIVLLGAEVAYTFQNQRYLSRIRTSAFLGRNYSQSFLGLYLLVRVSEAFKRAETAPTLSELSDELVVQTRKLRQAAEKLMDAGVLVQDARGEDRFVLAVDPRRVRIADAVRYLHACEFPGEAETELLLPPEKDQAGAGAAQDRIDRLISGAHGSYLESFGDESLDGGPVDSPIPLSPEHCIRRAAHHDGADSFESVDTAMDSA